MGHFLQAFVARRDLFDGGPRPTTESVLVDLRQGFAMLIEPEYDDQETELDAAVETFGVECSRNGPVAYVSTAYHGGIGDQAAIAWERGKVLLPYATAGIGPVSAALRAIGVVRGDAFDEFAAVGLGECRSHEDWIHFSRTGRHRWQTAPA